MKKGNVLTNDLTLTDCAASIKEWNLAILKAEQATAARIEASKTSKRGKNRSSKSK